MERGRTPLTPTGAKPPGPPASGVRVEKSGGVERIVIGNAGGVDWPVWLACVLGPASLGVLAYETGAASAYGAFSLAVLAALALLVGQRAMRTTWRPGDHAAVCLDSERIWIEHAESSSRWIEQARAAFADAPAPDAPVESLPLDSMPRSVVEQVRVDVREGQDAGATPYSLLLIEANAGRLELIGALSDRKRLEWVRDYLRFVLAQED